MNRVHPWREAPDAEFAVIGWPVKHSLSPRMHHAAYDALGLPYRYVAIEVAPGEVAQALDRLAELGYIGVNVTVPHKEEAREWCLDLDPMAAKVRAVNTVRLRDRAGMNTDAPGFLDTLDDVFEASESSRVCLLLGAGGSARALAAALSGAGWTLRLWNRTKERAEELAKDLDLDAVVLDLPDPSGADLVLNTTSASLSGQDLPIDWSLAKPGSLAVDLAYALEPTPFMKSASMAGLRSEDGRPLLVAQGARAFEWWIGLPAPRSSMAEAIR